MSFVMSISHVPHKSLKVLVGLLLSLGFLFNFRRSFEEMVDLKAIGSKWVVMTKGGG
jgi:hypothetical protein